MCPPVEWENSKQAKESYELFRALGIYAEDFHSGRIEAKVGEGHE